MTQFEDILNTLPDIDHLTAIEIKNAQGDVIDTIPNQAGKQGSLRVYNSLLQEFGNTLTKQAAQKGLDLFAQHTQDARENPGKHPNIDRLLSVINLNEQNDELNQLILNPIRA